MGDAPLSDRDSDIGMAGMIQNKAVIIFAVSYAWHEGNETEACHMFSAI